MGWIPPRVLGGVALSVPLLEPTLALLDTFPFAAPTGPVNCLLLVLNSLTRGFWILVVSYSELLECTFVLLSCPSPFWWRY